MTLITKMLILALVGLALTMLIACRAEGPGDAAGEAEFYECAPGGTLRVCEVGTGPPAGCEAVGSGTTTLPIEDCDEGDGPVEAAPELEPEPEPRDWVPDGVPTEGGGDGAASI